MKILPTLIQEVKILGNEPLFVGTAEGINSERDITAVQLYDPLLNIHTDVRFYKQSDIIYIMFIIPADRLLFESIEDGINFDLEEHPDVVATSENLEYVYNNYIVELPNSYVISRIVEGLNGTLQTFEFTEYLRPTIAHINITVPGGFENIVFDSIEQNNIKR